MFSKDTHAVLFESPSPVPISVVDSGFDIIRQLDRRVEVYLHGSADGRRLNKARVNLTVAWSGGSSTDVGDQLTDRNGHAVWILPKFNETGVATVSFAGDDRNHPATGEIRLKVPVHISVRVSDQHARVRVTDYFGNPLAGLRASLGLPSYANLERFGKYEGRTDKNGRITFGLAPVKYDITVRVFETNTYLQCDTPPFKAFRHKTWRSN